MWKSIRNQLLVSSIWLIVLPATIGFAWVFWQFSQAIGAEAETYAHNASELVANETRQSLDRFHSTLRILATHPDTRELAQFMADNSQGLPADAPEQRVHWLQMLDRQDSICRMLNIAFGEDIDIAIVTDRSSLSYTNSSISSSQFESLTKTMREQTDSKNRPYFQSVLKAGTDYRLFWCSPLTGIDGVNLVGSVSLENLQPDQPLDADMQWVYINPQEAEIYADLPLEERAELQALLDSGISGRSGDVIVTYQDLVVPNLSMMYISPTAAGAGASMQLRNLTLGVFILLILGVALSAGLINHRVAVPITHLAGQMRHYKSGKADQGKMNHQNEIGLLYSSFEEMQQNLDQLGVELLQREEEKRRYAISLLSEQIKPHMLFNTLNAVYRSIELDKMDKAARLTRSLIAYLDKILSDKRDTVPLDYEIDTIKAYCDIITLRRGTQLDFRARPADSCYMVPKLLLQPVVENVFKHAYGDICGSESISIRSYELADSHVIAVRDRGQGLPADQVKRLNQALADGTLPGLGLLNTHKRIQAFYGSDYGLHVCSIEGKGSLVLFRLPAEHSEGISS